MSNTEVMNRVIFRLRINWALVLAFVGWWSYGLYNAVSFSVGSVGIGTVVLAVLFALVTAFFVYVSNTLRERFTDEIIIRVRDVLVFFSFALLLLPLTFGAFSNSLVGDELSHAQRSQIHAIQFVGFLSGHTQSLDGFTFSSVLFIVTLLGIIVLALAFFALKHLSRPAFTFSWRGRPYPVSWAVIAVFVGFIATRLLVHLMGGGNEMHPPFRLFPLWLSSGLLSVGSFSFRLPQFLGLIGFMWVVERIARRRFSPSFSWLLGLVVGTIPLVWHIGTIIEPSLWTTIGWTFLILMFLVHAKGDPVPWVRIFSVLSVIALMRQTAIVGLVFAGVWYLISEKEKIKKMNVSFLVPVVPVLIAFPFVLKSFILGTSADYIPGELALIPSNAGVLARAWFALSSGVALHAILVSVLLPWALFLALAFIPLRSGTFKKHAALFLFFAAGFVMFYAVSPGLWGTPRYQAEYAVPFVIAGLFFLAAFLERSAVFRRTGAFFIVILVLLNGYVYATLPDRNPPVDRMVRERPRTFYDPYGIVSELFYDYKSAFKAVRDAGLSDSAYVAGVTYGSFGEILGGFSLSDIRAIERNGICCTEMTPEAVNADPRIKLVLISDLYPGKFETVLKGLGWARWKNFTNAEWGSTIVGLMRAS